MSGKVQDLSESLECNDSGLEYRKSNLDFQNCEPSLLMWKIAKNFDEHFFLGNRKSLLKQFQIADDILLFTLSCRLVFCGICCCFFSTMTTH